MGYDGGRAVLLSGTAVGELTVTRRWDDPEDAGPGYLVVEHADPRIILGFELAWRIAAGECHPCVKIYTACSCPTCGDLCLEHLPDTKLEIFARNRKLIYRFTECRFELDGYIAEWPD